MRIGFDAKRYFFNQTGLGNYSRMLIDGLKHHFPENDYLLFSPKSPALSVENIVTPQGFQPFWRQWGIINQFKDENLDIYHGLSAELPLKRFKKTKTVVTIHDLIFLRYPQYYPFIDRKIYKYKTQKAVENADKIVCVSQVTANDLNRFFLFETSKTEVLHFDCNPIFYSKKTDDELAKFRLRYNMPNQFLLIVSKFEKRKNHLSILKAIVDKNIDIPLVLVGKHGDSYDSVNQFIKKNELNKKCQIFTTIPTEDLPYFYQAAYASIFPSEYEGFGIPVLESMAGGTPVLTTKNSSMAEIGGNASLYFDAHNTEEIAEAIETVFQAEERNLITSKIPEQLKKFNHQHILNQYITMYKSVL
ncbi:MAG: glycosyltransferase family 4 protein [Flavobacteriales bacterium]|nr:glycosyltransferase family 4 protein [Flavobacteriales bacterium]